MAITTVTLLVLALIALVVAGICITRPHAGLAVMMLTFIPAPLYPMETFGWVFYGFAGFLLIVLMAWMLQVGWRAHPFDNAIALEGIASSLTLWLLLCALGLPLSLLINQGSFWDRIYFFAKGALPFVFLLVFIVVRALPFRERQVQRLLHCLLAVAIAFSAITFAIYAVTRMRVTWIYAPLQFPFAVLGANVTFSKMLTAQSRRGAFGWALLTGVLAIAALLTFTKAQMIAMVSSFVLVAVLLGKSSTGKIASRVAVFATVVVLLAAVAMASSASEDRTSFTEMLTARLSDSATTETRLDESREALLQFAESPVIGKGIGYQLERIEFGELISSNYVHNEIAYVGMTMGIAGLIVYVLLLCSWGALVGRFRLVKEEMKWQVATLHGCVLVLMVFALMFASFRTIQHNCLLGMFLGLSQNFTPPLENRKSFLVS